MLCALVGATLESMMIERPTPTQEQTQHLCLDAGYDYDAVYETARAHQYVPHIRPNSHNRAEHLKPVQEPEAETSSNLESTKRPRRSRSRTLALVDQSLSALVGSLGEAGFHLPSLLASGLWPYLFSAL